MNQTKRKYRVRYGLERIVTDNGHGIYTIEGEYDCLAGMRGEGHYDADGGVLDGNALYIGEDYGFGRIIAIYPEGVSIKNNQKYFKIRVEVEQ